MGGSKMDIKTTVASGKLSPVQIALYALFGIALVVSPILFEGFGLGFLTRIMALVGLYVMLALGLNIVVGFAGLLDLGYIAFYAIGGYAGVIATQAVMLFSAIEKYTSVGGKLPAGFSWGQVFTYGAPMKELAANPDFVTALLDVSKHNPILPWMFFIAIPLSAAVAALTGVILGTPVLRLRGDYLAIVTLGFGEIVRIVINNNAFGLTNGAAGLPRAGISLPYPAGLEWLMNNAVISIPNLGANGFLFTFSTNLYWYYTAVLLCILTIFVVRRLDNSRLGRSWIAMREDEVAASSMGISITGAKLWAFSLGALWGGIAGLAFANYQQFVSPESFTFMESVFVVCTIVIGGMGSIPGAIVGALLIQGTPELIRGFATSGIIKLTGEQVTAISNYRNLVFGIVMVVMMVWRPQGLVPSRRRAAELKNEDDPLLLAEENETLYDAQHDTAIPGEEL